MKISKLFLTLLPVIFLFASCEVKVDTGSSTEKKNENTEKPSGTTGGNQNQNSVTQSSNGQTIKAKFVDFQLGDASHYYFVDESGKEWDFAASEDKSIEFTMELPAKEITEQNQGWGPNKDLVGKWFNIKYEIKEMPQYQDGPMAKLPVIVEAKPAE